jgi:uncharacterized coiled-coil protein SlyX
MPKIDWDRPAELEACQTRIAELEAGIASQKQKIQRLFDRGMDAEFAQRILAVMEQSVERVRGHKHSIENMAERGAGEDKVAPRSEEPDEPGRKSK